MIFLVETLQAYAIVLGNGIHALAGLYHVGAVLVGLDGFLLLFLQASVCWPLYIHVLPCCFGVVVVCKKQVRGAKNKLLRTAFLKLNDYFCLGRLFTPFCYMQLR